MKRTQADKLKFQTSQRIHCQTPSGQRELLKGHLSRYNTKLSLFKEKLLNRRNNESISYIAATAPNRENIRKQRVRRDCSDGFPVSNEACHSQQDDRSEDLVNGQAAPHLAHQSTGRRETSDLVYDEESLEDALENPFNQILHGESSRSSTGQRLVSIQNTSFKSTDRYKMIQHDDINIPPSIQNELDHLEQNPNTNYDDLLLKLMKVNPQIPIAADQYVISQHVENRLFNEDMDKIEQEIDLLSYPGLCSQLWAESIRSLTTLDVDIGEMELLISDSTASSLVSDADLRLDEIDGPGSSNGYRRAINGHNVDLSAEGSSASGLAPSCSQTNGHILSVRETSNGYKAHEHALVHDWCRAGVNPLGYGFQSEDIVSSTIAERKMAKAVSKQDTSHRSEYLNLAHDHKDVIDDNGSMYQACSKDKMSLHSFLTTSVYCTTSACTSDFKCCQGKRLLLQLQNNFQMDELKQARNILEFVWIHSKDCYELECAVPFCNLFKQRPPSSFEEHFAALSRGSLNRSLQMELVNAMERQVQSDDFLLLMPNDPVSFATWTTARMLKGQFIGQFGDFNILRGQLTFCDSSRLEVVIKKVNSYKNSQHVYFQLGQLEDSAPFIAKNYWCSKMSEHVLLVCSVYYRDWSSLNYQSFHPQMTSDLELILIRQITQAAQYLHSLTPGILYLSWKCSNVLWDGSRNIKLCNFSRAIQLQPGEIHRCPLTIRKRMDPRFTAPEVLCGDPVGFYSDIWGIGCLFYELVAKRPPYPDDSHIPPTVIREMVCANRIDHHYPSSRFLGILMPCWERNPCDRWSSCDHLLTALSATGSAVER